MAAIVQKPLHTCSDHEHEETDMYCKTCKKPVCVRCVKNEHKEHEWDSMKNVAKKLRAETIQRKLEMTSISKSIVIGVSEILDSVSERSDKQFFSNCNELESTRKKIVRYVNKEIDRMKAKCEDNHKTKTKIMQEHRDKLKAKENRMKFMIHEMETGVTDFTDFDLIEMHKELKLLLTELQRPAEIPPHLYDDTVYARGHFDVSIITTLLGSIEDKQFSQNPFLKHRFQYNEKENSGSYIEQICPMTKNEAWVHVRGATLLKLVDSEGNEKKSVDIKCDCFDFTVAENGTIHFLDADAQCVKVIDRDGKITSFFLSSPLIPTSICRLRSGDLLLSSGIKTNEEGKRCLLRRISCTGDVIKDYEIENDGETSNRLYIWQAIEHFNGNIGILVLYLEDEVNEVEFTSIFRIDHDDMNVFKYGDKKDSLGMISICCDTKEITLAYEPAKDRIHIISAKGNLIRYLFTDKLSEISPHIIALLGDTLWIGSKTGMIEVYKYDCSPSVHMEKYEDAKQLTSNE